MVDEQIKTSDPNNPNSGYDVYYKGKIIGWARTPREAQNILNQAKMANQQNPPSQNQPDQATADQNRFIVNVAAKLVPTSKVGWTVVIFILIILWGLWYFDLWSFITPYFMYLFVTAFLFFVGWGFITGLKEGKNEKFFISFALIVWAVDLTQNVYIPFFGPISLGNPFAGFIWDWQGTLNTDWVAVTSSFIVFLFLYFNMLGNIVRHEYRAFLLSFIFILLMNNYVTGFIKLGSIAIPYGKFIYFLAIFVLLFFVYKFGKKYRVREIPNFLSSLFMIFVFSFFWINNGWIGNLKALIHVAFILAFGFGYIAKREEPLVKNILIPSLLIVDFYGYGALFNSDYLILKFIPLLVIFVIAYCYYKTNSGFAMASFIVLVTIFVIFSFKAYGYDTSTVQFKEKPGETFDNFLSTTYSQFGLFGTTITQSIVNRLDYATGGLYRGSVEKNQYESLGVYFSNIRASEPKFYNDEPVTIWGSIRSKTYQDPVIVNFKCYKWKTSADKQNRVQSTTYEPKNPFLVFQLEQNDVECTFQPTDSQKLDVGSNTVTLSSEYNFATNAYKKAYFMDKDRYRALIKESIDPFKEFGIKDTQPKPVYTNGPVEIGIDIQPLTPVSDSYVVYPTLGISLLNRQQIEDKDKKIITKWEGRIKNITELVVLMPPGIDIANKEKLDSACSKENIGKGECPCNRPFVTYDLHKCFTSCTKQVLEPCNDACSAYGKGSEAEKNCINTCVSSFDNCNSECNSFFGLTEGQSTQYNGYALDVERLEYKNEYKDIESDRHRTFVCRIKPTTQVLDNTPITTRYFRVRARYNYLLENSVPVNVEQVLGAISPGVSTSITKYALTEGVDPDLIKAIAIVESKAKHCNDGSTDCPKDQVVFNGISLGMMQINVRDAPGFGWKTDASKICGYGKTVYDVDCNIQLGIRVLKDKYNEFGKDNKPRTYKCGNLVRIYSGWDAAVRGYNGWACTGANLNYVEDVRKAYNDIKNGIISSEIQSRLQSIEKYFPKTGNKPSAPSNANAFDTPNAARSITISWSPSTTSNVRYGIYRYSPDGTSFAQYTEIGQTSYVDNSVEEGVDYYYKITAVSDMDESDPLQTASTKSVDDAIAFT